MIVYRKGNLFDSDADCIFNTVNCEGFMGKGIAYQFKRRFPENNKEYVKYCEAGKLKPGVLFIFKENGKTIVNFPTKDRWRSPSKMEYISSGLDAFVDRLSELDVKKAALPPLGCGNGGLNWDDVKSLIEKKLASSEVLFEIYEPGGADNSERSEKMTVNELISLYVQKKLDNYTSLRFQKTFYFADFFGGSKEFLFSRGKQGPYSKDLYHASVRVKTFQRQKGLSNPGEAYEAIYRVICSEKTDRQYNKRIESIDKALDLVNHVKEDLLLEGMATALYLIKDEGVIEEESIVTAFKEWSDDKAKRFDRSVIYESLDKLVEFDIMRKDIMGQYVMF